ncbi:MAG TPA: KTSC domain-containing protein [Ramlibacter sp.]|nr:KTSC domain-containing protein [Ramlibacter sp.]
MPKTDHATTSEDEYVPIPMAQVSSSQIACIGYDAARKTLAVQFTRGAGAEYQYPNVEPKLHADFMAAESIGKFFGAHIKALPFKKFAAPVKSEQAAPAASA